MSATLYYRWNMKFAALLSLVIAVGHIVLPTYGYSSDITTSWSTEAKDHFFYLASYTIAAFLIALGILSFIYSLQRPSRPVAWFGTVLTLLWTVRLILEYQLPTNIKILFLESPHSILLLLLAIITLLYGLAAGIAWGMILIKK